MSACERINSIAWDDTYCFDKMADWIDFSFGSVFIVLIGAQELNFYRATTHKQQQQKNLERVDSSALRMVVWTLTIGNVLKHLLRTEEEEKRRSYIYIYTIAQQVYDLNVHVSLYPFGKALGHDSVLPFG